MTLSPSCLGARIDRTTQDARGPSRDERMPWRLLRRARRRMTNLGSLLAQSGQVPKAEQQFQAALQIDSRVSSRHIFILASHG